MENLNSRPELTLEDCGRGGTHSTTLCSNVCMMAPTFIAKSFPYDVPSEPESGYLVAWVFFKKIHLARPSKSLNNVPEVTHTLLDTSPHLFC